jgi:predicted dehydrogenase
VDDREDSSRNLSRTYKTARCFPVLADVDAVVVAAPPSTHVDVALAAIRAGKHVLVEKPLASTSTIAGARTLARTASDAGVLLIVGHTFEYHPAVRKQREILRSQELGELYCNLSGGRQ